MFTQFVSGTAIKVLRPFAAGTRGNRNVIRAGSKGRVVGWVGHKLEVLTEDGYAVLDATEVDTINNLPV